MAKVDYIQLQIEQLGKFLRLAIAKITGKESTLDNDLKETKSTLKTEYEIDLDQLKNWTSDEFIQHLQQKESFSLLNLEYVADLLVLISENESNANAKQQYLIKSLAIYIHLDKTDRTYSEERKRKIVNITSQIEA